VGFFVFKDIYSNMKLIIKESHTGIIRRYERIKEMFQDYLLVHNVTSFDTFDSFFQSLCWDIAVNMVDRTKMDQDSYVTLRNQIIRFIKTHFYSEYKEWWDRRKNRINENVDKNKKFLTKIMGIDFTDKIQQITSSYDVPMSFDEVIGPDMIRRYLNHWGPMYLVNINGKKYLYQDKGDEDGKFEWFLGEDGIDYVDDEIPEKLGISEMGLRFSDIIDMYFKEEL